MFLKKLLPYIIPIGLVIQLGIEPVIGQESISYYNNKNIRSKGMLVDSLKESEWRYYYPDGTLEAIENYRHDNLNGKALYYNEDAQLIASETWINGLQEDSATYFYSNGQIEKRGLFNNSLHEGIWLFFYENGRLKRSGNYRGGLPDGLWKFYTYPSGRKRVLSMELTLNGGMAGGFGKIYESGLLSGSGEMMGPVKGKFA